MPSSTNPFLQTILTGVRCNNMNSALRLILTRILVLFRDEAKGVSIKGNIRARTDEHATRLRGKEAKEAMTQSSILAEVTVFI
jgi:hypothetical protein